MKKQLLWYLSLCLWVTAWALGTVFIYERWLNPRKHIVMVDIESLLKEQIVLAARVAKGKSADRKRTARQIDRAIMRVLRRIADDNDVIIVPKQAILAGDTEDITDLVRSVIVRNGKSLQSNLALFPSKTGYAEK